jgi:hypothetical protein
MSGFSADDPSVIAEEKADELEVIPPRLPEHIFFVHVPTDRSDTFAFQAKGFSSLSFSFPLDSFSTNLVSSKCLLRHPNGETAIHTGIVL